MSTDWTIEANKEYGSGVKLEDDQLIWYYVDDILDPKGSYRDSKQSVKSFIKNGPKRGGVKKHILDGIYETFNVPTKERKYKERSLKFNQKEKGKIYQTVKFEEHWIVWKEKKADTPKATEFKRQTIEEFQKNGPPVIIKQWQLHEIYDFFDIYYWERNMFDCSI
jgi:hypothetical protein